MRLKKIELHGFKSFPERTVMDLESGITALVGPNGCGKSNIVDAVRWCMGETNARRLRGNLLEDLIYLGGNGNKSEGMAEVTLCLSPENGGFPAEFSSDEEITVCRRLFRDGTSEYFLNGSPCRLKDISQIFMDTGSGARAYSLIEQGEVASLVEARPEERRTFLEQVAGIGRYRSRIQEASRRMEDTRKNLELVGNTLREIRKQLKVLEYQAGRAEESRKVREQVMGLGLSLDLEIWRELGVRFTQSGTAREEAENLDTEVGAALAREESIESEREVKIRAQAEEIERGRREEEEIRERIRLLEKERSQLEWNEEARVREIERNREETGSWEIRRTEVREEMEKTVRSREELGQELARSQQELAGQEEAQAALRERFQELEREQGERKDRLIRLIEEEARLSNRESLLADKVQAAEERKRRVEREIEELAGELTQLEGRESQFQEFELGERKKEEEAETERNRLGEEIKESELVRRALKSEISDREGQIISLRATLAALREEEIPEDQVDFPGRESFPRLDSVLEVDPEAEMAVEACLQERLKARLVPEAEAGLAAARALQAETSPREVFLPHHPKESLSPSAAEGLAGRAIPLLAKVRCVNGYRELAEFLFRDTYLVSSLDLAAQIWAENGRHLTLVTPVGEMVFPSGEVRGGRLSNGAGRLARRRKIREAAGKLEIIDAELMHYREKLAEVEQRGEIQEESTRRLNALMENQRLGAARREKERESLAAELERLRRKQGILEMEKHDLEQEAAGLKIEAEETSSGREEMIRKKSELEQGLESIQKQVAELKPELEEKDQELLQQKLKAAAVEERQSSLEQMIEKQSSRMGEIELEIEKRREAIAAGEKLGEEIRNRRAEIEAELNQLFLRGEEIQGMVREKEAAYQQELAEQRELQERIKVIRQNRDEIQRRLQELRKEEAEIRVELEGIHTRICERYGQEPDENISTPYDQVEREERERRLAKLREKLEEIGEVNPAALREFEETKQRNEWLTQQRDDLTSSLSRLQRAIVRMNKTSREKLVEAFELVNQSFVEVFPRLFKGGEGRLAWVGEDPLEAGLDIVARPEGKRPRSLSLLSGGEKALASVAFLISCFLAHPSPFCVLDEVDAPLDEANINRFNSMVRELAERSQFIMITHNRRTMEMADVLYGVTMEEPGVSKLVSVRLN